MTDHAPEREDDLLEEQQGKGYGDDEGEREDSFESETTESPIEGP
jgi:hypothetical protein